MFIAILNTTALGELCAGSALSIGGLIGFFSLRAALEKRGQLFHGRSGRGAPFSKLSLAALASFFFVFGGSLIIAACTDGNAPKWTIPILACVFAVMVAFGFVDAIRHDHAEDSLSVEKETSSGGAPDKLPPPSAPPITSPAKPEARWT